MAVWKSKCNYISIQYKLKVLHVNELFVMEKKSIQLGIARGGCGSTAGSTKVIFAQVAACFQVLPFVAQFLLIKGGIESKSKVVLMWLGFNVGWISFEKVVFLFVLMEL